MGFSHADRQVAVAKLFKFLKGFVCFLSIVNAVSTINFLSDGFNLAFQAHIQRINRREFALAAVCQGNYFLSKVDTALAAFSEYVGQCYVNTVFSAMLANCLQLFCGILSEDVDGNYAGNAEFFNVFDMLLQIYQTFFNCLYVRSLQVGFRYTAVHLQCTNGSNDNGCVRFQACITAFDIKEFFCTQVSAEACLGDSIIS